jgi:hypothetical protein
MCRRFDPGPDHIRAPVFAGVFSFLERKANWISANTGALMVEPYFQKYLRRAEGQTDPVAQLRKQGLEFETWATSVPLASTSVQHPPYTWTLTQVLNHVIDTERVFAFRAFWMARGACEPLPSFNEHEFARNSGASETGWLKLVHEFQTVRASSVALFENLPQDAWKRSGIAAGYSLDAAMLCGMIFGHLDHHFDILQSRLK